MAVTESSSLLDFGLTPGICEGVEVSACKQRVSADLYPFSLVNGDTYSNAKLQRKSFMSVIRPI